jgi:hypothetical protein
VTFIEERIRQIASTYAHLIQNLLVLRATSLSPSCAPTAQRCERSPTISWRTARLAVGASTMTSLLRRGIPDIGKLNYAGSSDTVEDRKL